MPIFPILAIIGVSLISSFCVPSKKEKREVDQEETKSVDPIAEFAQSHCVNEGTLQKIKDYVYIKLNDEYLTLVFNKIKETNPEAEAPSFHGNIGPHISIIRHDEWRGTPPEKISEIGNKYRFNPVLVDIIQTKHKRLWVMIIEPSRKLATLREQYAIGSLPHGHAFHITLAQQSIEQSDSINTVS